MGISNAVPVTYDSCYPEAFYAASNPGLARLAEERGDSYWSPATSGACQSRLLRLQPRT